jgi:hypothetical protein
MDMKKYTSGFITPDDLLDGPRRERIVNVYQSDKHSAFVLDLESGDQLMVWHNSPNARALGRAYGHESEDWRGHMIELSHGTYTKDGEEKGMVILKTISSRDGNANGGPQRVDPAKLPKPKDDMNDEIPF